MRPATVPSSWDKDWEVHTLRLSIEEYISNRLEKERVIGVLPRKRNPVAVSIFALAVHPFGRDKNQSPLGATTGDVVTYDPKVASKESRLLVTPSLARRILLSSGIGANGASNNRNTKLKLPFHDWDSEFAREMLMFPLSIKNPGVPLISGGRARRRRRGSTAMKRAEDVAAEEREKAGVGVGPERYSVPSDDECPLVIRSYVSTMSVPYPFIRRTRVVYRLSRHSIHSY